MKAHVDRCVGENMHGKEKRDHFTCKKLYVGPFNPHQVKGLSVSPVEGL